MTRLAALILLFMAALAAPGIVVLVEWLRTILGFLNLAPDIAYIPNGFQNFYIIIVATTVLVGLPVAWHRITQAEFRLSKYVGTYLTILIFWKVIDVTIFSETSAGGIGGSGISSNLVLSVGTFGYAVLAALTFWIIAIRPHQRLAQSQTTEGVANG